MNKPFSLGGVFPVLSVGVYTMVDHCVLCTMYPVIYFYLQNK